MARSLRRIYCTLGLVALTGGPAELAATPRGNRLLAELHGRIAAGERLAIALMPHLLWLSVTSLDTGRVAFAHLCTGRVDAALRRAQRQCRLWLARRHRARALAFAMAAHPRLGARSPARVLPCDLLRAC